MHASCTGIAMIHGADNALDRLYQCFTLLFPFSYVAILRHRLDIIVIPILERRKLRLIEVK